MIMKHMNMKEGHNHEHEGHDHEHEGDEHEGHEHGNEAAAGVHSNEIIFKEELAKAVGLQTKVMGTGSFYRCDKDQRKRDGCTRR